MDNYYAIAAALAENGKLEAAWKIIGEVLNHDPDDVRGLVTGSYIMQRSGSLPQAYHFARRATELAPDDDSTWTNLGHAASQMWLVEEAERYYRKGLTACKSFANRNILWLNLAGLYIDQGKFDKAEMFIQKLLDIDPTHKTALANIGFCQLAKRNWAEGWKNYHHNIGSAWRKKVVYKGEPEWDGSPGKTVVLYADQGLGDEVLFASMVPDAARISKKLILDCDGRLEGLFRRSFPGVKVYGTRVKDEKWAKEDRDVEASLPMGQVGEFVRLTDADFPSIPYLVPCPDRLTQWRGTFERVGVPVIGIAWTGGTPKTGYRMRRAMLEDFLPLFQSIDAHFVSLQYKDAADEIAAFRLRYPDVDLVQYPWATLTNDYDDTAGMVAALDCVVGVPTSVIHLAGALGVKTFALKAPSSCWKYSAGLPFHPATLIEHQGTWTQTIKSAVTPVVEHCESLSGMTRVSPWPTTSCSTPSSGIPPDPSRLHR